MVVDELEGSSVDLGVVAEGSTRLSLGRLRREGSQAGIERGREGSLHQGAGRLKVA